MGIFNFRSKKQDVKTHIPYDSRKSVLDYQKMSPLAVLSGGPENSAKYIEYYLKVAPLKNSVDILDQAIHTIQPLIYDDETEEYSDSDPILELLKKPNAVESYETFMSKIVIYLLVTGNIYIVGVGQVNRAPLELYVIPPQDVTIQADSKGFAGTYDINTEGVSQTYYREEIRGTFKYYTKDKSQELFHAKFVNPVSSNSSLYGTPKIQGLEYALEQYLAGDIHNLSLLERGGRPSLIYTSEFNMTQDQMDSVKDQLYAEIIGAENAGRTQVLECGLKVQDVSKSNKDMDYSVLRDKLTKTIYNHLRIPLAFVSENTMTYNNLEIAQLNLYDNSVIPLINKIFSELTKFLIPRYTKSDTKRITFDPSEVLALEPRRNEELAKINDLGVLSINEMRELIRYDEVEGGDEILVSSSETPLAEVEEQADEPEKPKQPKDDEEADLEEEAEKAIFQEILSKQMDEKGNPLFSEDKIKGFVKEYGN